MSDPIATPETKEEIKPEEKVSPAPSATTDEHMIPKSRLDEVLAKAEKAEKALLKFQEAEDKRKKDELSELDRLKLEKQEAEQKAQQAEAQLQTERTHNEVISEANKPQFGDKKQKFISPEIAYKLLTPEMMEKGIVKGLESLAKENPFLLEKPATGDSVGSPNRNKSKQVSEEKRNVPIPRF